MTPELTSNADGGQTARWTLPFSATLGSSVRAKGIFQAARLRLPSTARKLLQLKGTELSLDLSATGAGEVLVAAVSKALEGMEARPVIPREIEDILGMKPTERHRWLKDGRLKSAGTRTVKLAGRAKKITFHVFEPELVEDLLNRDAIIDWREEDKLAAAENRRRAAWKSKQARMLKAQGGAAGTTEEATLDDNGRPNLIGWEEFERTGLLR
jgi:hypothetical protein